MEEFNGKFASGTRAFKLGGRSQSPPSGARVAKFSASSPNY